MSTQQKSPQSDQTQPDPTTVHFEKEWKPLRSLIHQVLNTLHQGSNSLKHSTSYLRNDILEPLYQSTLHNTRDSYQIIQNLTLEYPIILIGASGALFAALMGRGHRVRKFLLGSVLCTAVCYPNHAVKLFMKPVEFAQEFMDQSSSDASTESSQGKRNNNKDQL